MLLALLRLVQYTGNISIDGRDIKSVPLDILRTRITTITQSGLELWGTIRFNLNPFDREALPQDYTLTEEMEEDALARVGLLDIVRSRGGLQAEMKDARLSQGQRQLFQIARAILHQKIMNSTIVLVDEGTSSMDEETERRMHSLIGEVFAPCTKILITHRPTTIANAHAVITLTNGRADVVERNG